MGVQNPRSVPGWGLNSGSGRRLGHRYNARWTTGFGRCVCRPLL